MIPGLQHHPSRRVSIIFRRGAIRQNQADSCLVVTESLIDIGDAARVG